MKQLTIREAADFLLRNDNYVLLTHRRPDGDTIGSAAALCAGLRSLGKTAHVLENPQFTEKFRPWLGKLTCETLQSVLEGLRKFGVNRAAKPRDPSRPSTRRKRAAKSTPQPAEPPAA